MELDQVQYRKTETYQLSTGTEWPAQMTYGTPRRPPTLRAIYPELLLRKLRGTIEHSDENAQLVRGIWDGIAVSHRTVSFDMVNLPFL